jgi:hypothetical protein
VEDLVKIKERNINSIDNTARNSKSNSDKKV